MNRKERLARQYDHPDGDPDEPTEYAGHARSSGGFKVGPNGERLVYDLTAGAYVPVRKSGKVETPTSERGPI